MEKYRYLEYAKRYGKHQPITRKCGFIIHPTMGFLGASSDAHVMMTHTVNFKDSRNAEFKCRFARKMLLHWKLVRICKYYNGSFHLKRSHHYYHQVQLQLYGHRLMQYVYTLTRKLFHAYILTANKISEKILVFLPLQQITWEAISEAILQFLSENNLTCMVRDMMVPVTCLKKQVCRHA